MYFIEGSEGASEGALKEEANLVRRSAGLPVLMMELVRKLKLWPPLPSGRMPPYVPPLTTPPEAGS